MSSDSRHEVLVARARERGFARVADLAAELGVSGMTIRRDLDLLESRGLVKRVRGGVVAGHGTSGGATSEFAEVDAAAETQARHIGVLVPDLGFYAGDRGPGVAQAPDARYYFQQVLAGARAELERAGVRARLMFSPMPERLDSAASGVIQAHERRLVDELLTSGASGLLFSPNGTDGSMDDYLEWLSALPIPVVLMERELAADSIAPKISSVRTAHEVGVRMAVTHLYEQGHRRILVLRHLQSQTAESIHQGWLRVAAALDLDHGLTLAVSDLADWPAEATVDAFLREQLERGVTAMLCHNDNNAFMVLRRLQAMGLHVPRDVSLISYDDDFAELFDPPMTAVAPPRQYVGRLAARLLADRFDGLPVGAAHVRVEPGLVLRQSVGRAPSSV
ncbi:substrate-binding domain-containing protein [Jiangella endophytica]|uniref:substrate-binding domain-containing protein n=1 Tax=Jiangella endophytica TaxID=1623398 RepID=UPI0022B80F39|nr:substrate-binding domain-containing protein [Jiangella endophytica]